MTANPKLVYKEHSIVHNCQERGSSFVVDVYSLYDSHMVLYRRHLKNKSYREVSERSLSNLQKEKFTGNISKAKASRIRRKLTAWLKSIEAGGKAGYRKKDGYVRKPVFLTLTLSAEQIVSDNVVKRKLLTPFIAELRRKYGVTYYFWRAEAQKNGNIHFHLIVDNYLPYKQIREVWNRHQNALGLIDKFEAKHLHRQPNSVDLKGVADVKNFIAYVLKYALKDEKHRKLNGRIYGMSDELRELDIFTGVLTNELSEELKKEEKNKTVFVKILENATIIYFNKDFKKSRAHSILELTSGRSYLIYYCSLYSVVPPSYSHLQPNRLAPSSRASCSVDALI